MALGKALGDRKGIVRFGHFLAPLDEALVQVTLDFSGRPHLSYGLEIPTQRVGTYDTQLVREFYVAVVNHSQMTLHIRQLDGINSHHIIEATVQGICTGSADGSGNRPASRWYDSRVLRVFCRV
jgi:imidazoleglycerol-phosphate dehydratase